MSIHSIRFTDTHKEGFLFKHATEYKLKKGKTYEDYEKAQNDPQKYRKYGRDIKDHFFKEVDCGLANKLANKCLINKTFNFSTDKINILFGPNASGKTTILKAIAKYALCGSSMDLDGPTNVVKYTANDFYSLFDEFRKLSVDDIREKTTNERWTKGNPMEIDWDGNSVYYHNFDGRRKSGTADDFVGTIMGDFGSALLFHMDEKSMNAGKRSIRILGQFEGICNQNVNLREIVTSRHLETLEKLKENPTDSVVETTRAVYEYILEHLGEDKGTYQNTILFDEIDNHLDIPSVITTYRDVLPYLQSINNHQIITVSHSPFVLSPTVCDPDKYNIISMSDKYTENVRSLLKTIEF